MIKKIKYFKKHKDLFEEEVKSYINSLGKKNKLVEACDYILSSGGKRFRPIIVLLLAEAIGKKMDVFPSALSVELFHTASLIADDLPCMDNEEERRSKPALHLKYNESIALLSSYTLISAGYEMLSKNCESLIRKNGMEESKANELCVTALKEISKVAGIEGATGGQFLDLFPPDNSAETIYKIIKQKTVALFDISFILGWVYGGGDLSKIEDIKQCSYHFGMAFQIADDIDDLEQDIENGNHLNIVRALGKEKSFEVFHEELDLFRKKMDQLKILTDPFKYIVDLLEGSIKR